MMKDLQDKKNENAENELGRGRGLKRGAAEK